MTKRGLSIERRLVAVTGSTPGDRRALANLRAAVNRARRPA